MKRKNFGKCALCGKECELTFEHIPPRAAFNFEPARPVSAMDIITDSDRMPWDVSGLPYTNQQRGMGAYSLCKECNNNTGTFYGNDYVKFARSIHYFRQQNLDSQYDAVKVKEVYPLRIIKQVVSMFCSINRNMDNESMAILREFVLSKEQVGLDKTLFRVCMYLEKNQTKKYNPFTVVGYINGDEFDIHSVSEISAYPFGYILYFDPKDGAPFEGWDITEFADCGYDEPKDIIIPLETKEVHNIFPMDYRSKEEIQGAVGSVKNVEE